MDKLDTIDDAVAARRFVGWSGICVTAATRRMST